jgi:hypothetical protein
MCKPIIALILCFTLSSFVGAQNSSYDKETLDLFTPYAASDALKYVAHLHAFREGLTKGQLVLYSTWFVDGNPKIAMQTRIKADGDVYKVRDVYNWAEQAAKRLQLSADELETLLTTIQKLPDSQSPPLEFLVVVTFQRAGKWQTRIYDRRQPPDSLVTIYKLAGSVMPTR